MAQLSIIHFTDGQDMDFGADFVVTKKSPKSFEIDAPLISDFDAVILDASSADLLSEIRASTNLTSIPVFAVDEKLSVHALSDGAVTEDLAAILRVKRATHEKDGQSLSEQDSVLAYLWKLGDRRLSPQVDLGRSKVFVYPLLDAL